MRKYSWVRMERKRGATAESHGMSSDRHRSMATRSSRRNATQAGHASICMRIWSHAGASTRPSIYSERLANSSRHSAGRSLSFVRAVLRAFFAGVALRCSATVPSSIRAISLRTQRRARCRRTRTVPGCSPRIVATCSVVSSSMSWSTRTIRNDAGICRTARCSTWACSA